MLLMVKDLALLQQKMILNLGLKKKIKVLRMVL